jgi:phosphopantetheine--protein transferase-like protein
VLSAVHLAGAPDPVPEEVLARLGPGEQALARTLGGYRQDAFVGGRLAIHAAASQLGRQLPDVLPDERGAPIWPRGLTGSVSHKGTLAIALLAVGHGETIGVDLEDYAPARPAIERRVLTPEELDAIADLDGERRWIATALRFSLKESVYKALAPVVRRYIGFDEAIVTPDLRGEAEVVLRLSGGEGPFELDARYAWLRGRILTSVRARPL